MGKKAQDKPQTKKKNTKKSEAQIRKRERQNILRKLKQITKPYNNNRNSNKRDKTQVFSITEKSSTFVQQNANKSYENTISHRKCYRCRHFLEIPQNLSRPFCERIPSSIGRCKAELSFVQAIVWLKSATDCVSQISVEQLRSIFNRQWNTRGNYNYSENKHIDDVEQLKRPVNKDLSICEKTNMRDVLAISTPRDTIGLSYINTTPQRSTYKSCATPGDAQNDTLSLMLDLNETLESEFLMQESCADYITENRNKTIDLNLAFETPDMFDSVIAQQDECYELETVTRCLVQPASENNIGPLNKEITKNTNDTESNPAPSPSFFNSRCRNVFPIRGRDATAQINEQYMPFSPATNRSVESNFLLLLNSNINECFTPMISQFKSCDEFSLASYSNPKDLNLTQVNTPEINNDATLWKQQTSNNSQIDQTPSNAFNNDKTEFEIQIDVPDSSNSPINNKNSEYDSAYSTLHINVHNCDVEMTAKHTTNKRISGNNIGHRGKSPSPKKKTIMCEKKVTGHRYELRTNRKKIVTREKEVIQEPRKNLNRSKKQSERKSGRGKNRLEEEKGNQEEVISAEWLSFTLDSLNVEQVILESLKVILSTLGHKRIMEAYAMRRYWKGTLEEEAINAVLNISDIFTMEKKPNICGKVIVTTIIQTLDEITTCVQLNKTSVWIYRIQIILELCNSLSICVKIVDYLIAKLKSFESALIDTTEIQKDTHARINQVHLVFYAINITLRKYRAVIPKDRKSRSKESVIPHVADLWKTRYIEKELEDTGLDLDTAEERWSNALESFAVASTKYFVQFAEESLSLARLLISQ